MDTISFFLNTLPFSLMVIMFFRYLFIKNKNNFQRTFTWILFFTCGFYFQHGIIFNPQATATELTIANIVGHISAPMLLFFIFRNLYRFHKIGRNMRRIDMLFALPLFVSAATLMVFLLLDWNDIVLFWQYYARDGHLFPKELEGNQWLAIFHLLNIYVYFGICTISTIGVMAYIIYCMIREKFGFADLYNFLFHGGEMTHFKMTFCLTFIVLALSICRMGLGRSGAIEHPYLTMVLSLMIALVMYDMCRLGMLPSMVEFTRKDVMHPLAIQSPSLEDTSSKLAVTATEEEQRHLKERFIDLVDNQHIFTDPALSIDGLASKLSSNRVQIAQIIDELYHQPFRDFLTAKRIEFAKQLMLEKPHITQQDLATQCGFIDAASFNKRFTQLEGVTPNKWRKSHFFA